MYVAVCVSIPPLGVMPEALGSDLIHTLGALYPWTPFALPPALTPPIHLVLDGPSSSQDLIPFSLVRIILCQTFRDSPLSAIPQPSIRANRYFVSYLRPNTPSTSGKSGKRPIWGGKMSNFPESIQNRLSEITRLCPSTWSNQQKNSLG
jgi:hypothetical protein